MTDGLRTTKLSSDFGLVRDEILWFPFALGSCASSDCELVDEDGDADDQCAGVSASALETRSPSILGKTSAAAGTAGGLCPGMSSGSIQRYCFEYVVWTGVAIPSANALGSEALALEAAGGTEPSPAVTAVMLTFTLAALDFLRIYGLKRHSIPWPEHLMLFFRHLKHSGSALSQMTRRVRHSRQPG